MTTVEVRFEESDKDGGRNVGVVADLYNEEGEITHDVKYPDAARQAIVAVRSALSLAYSYDKNEFWERILDAIDD